MLAEGPHQKCEVPSAQTGLVHGAALAHRRLHFVEGPIEIWRFNSKESVA